MRGRQGLHNAPHTGTRALPLGTPRHAARKRRTGPVRVHMQHAPNTNYHRNRAHHATVLNVYSLYVRPTEYVDCAVCVWQHQQLYPHDPRHVEDAKIQALGS